MAAASLLTGAVAIVICGGFYVREIGQLEQNWREREASRISVFISFVTHDLHAAADDLRILADGDGLRAFLTSGREEDFARAVRRAVFFSREQPAFDQLRLLDMTGRELLRVNRGGQVVPAAELQDKSDRPYFKETLKLAPGAIFVSAIDLNIEHGQVEQPPKPMLRLATPVTDESGRVHGIYVINYSAGQLLGRLGAFAPAYQHRLRVLNAEGYWLKTAQPENEWGFMFPDRAGASLARTEPGLWRRLLAEPAGQDRHAGGLFTWRRVPTVELLGNPPGAVAEDAFLVVASEISADEWTAIFARQRQSFLVVVLVLGASMVLTLLLLRSRQRSRQDLDRFFTLTRDLLCIANFEGFFKRLNPAWQITLGYTEAELRAQPFLAFVHPDDRDRTIAETSALSSGGESTFFENRYRCKDGSYRWLLWSARSLVAERLIFASARDVTEHKEAEEKIRRLNTELQLHNARLEIANKELESFSYSVSHDLRAPLRHIDGFASLLSSHAAGKLDEKGLRFISVIADSARRMGRLIDDLLTFSRMGRVQMSPGEIDHAQLVAGVIREGGFDHNPRISWKIGPLPPVRADAVMLRQVWLNLVDNAVKYSSRSNPPCIEIGRAESAAADHEQIFFIRDNGVGFDMKYAAKLFGVFQRLHSDAEFEGTGIGLANIRRIVTRHGGRTWAESSVGAGATFYFSLPDNPS